MKKVEVIVSFLEGDEKYELVPDDPDSDLVVSVYGNHLVLRKDPIGFYFRVEGEVRRLVPGETLRFSFIARPVTARLLGD